MGVRLAMSGRRGGAPAVCASVPRRYRERFAGFAALPMQDSAAACDELVRTVEEFGMWGGYVGTDGPRPLDSPDFDPPRRYGAISETPRPRSVPIGIRRQAQPK